MKALHGELVTVGVDREPVEGELADCAPGLGPSASDDLWARVDAIVDGARGLHELRVHGVELIAARLWRRMGRPVPAELCNEERRAAMAALAAPALLGRARAAYDGTLVLMKGPEAAARYPDPALRPFIDLDLLVDDAGAAWRALRGYGFEEVGDPTKYKDIHHLRPLAWPGLPLAIELHREVNHAGWLSAPATAALLGLTQPSATGVEGLRAPVPAAHALLLSLHGWAHEPLRRLLDLIDVAVVLDDEERRLAEALARRWGLQRMWRVTLAAVDALLHGRGHGLALRVWGRHLASVRERTVLETHLARWAAPASGLPRPGVRALGTATLTFAGAAGPRGDERWADALGRTGLAVGDAFRPQSRHSRTRELGSRR
jgi:hypothetical protein